MFPEFFNAGKCRPPEMIAGGLTQRMVLLIEPGCLSQAILLQTPIFHYQNEL
jgi:hypothetical protein